MFAVLTTIFIMHVKDPKISVVKIGHCDLLAGFCMSLYSLHVLNWDVNMIQTTIFQFMTLLVTKLMAEKAMHHSFLQT